MSKKIYLTIIWLLVLLAIIVGLGIHVTNWFSWLHKDNGKEIKEETALEEFESIEVEAGAVELTFDTTGDAYKVSYSTTSESLVPEVKVVRGALKIYQDKDSIKKLIGTNSQALKLKITIPENVALKNISLEVGACDVDLSSLRASSLSIDSGAGDVDIQNSTIEKILVDAGAGDVDLSNVNFNTLEVDAGAGDVDIIGVSNPEEYSFDVSVGMGELTINEQSQGGIGADYKTEGTTDKKITIDSGAGDVDVSE